MTKFERNLFWLSRATSAQLVPIPDLVGRGDVTEEKFGRDRVRVRGAYSSPSPASAHT